MSSFTFLGPSWQHDHVFRNKTRAARFNDWGRHIPEALCSQSLGIRLTPISLGQKPGKTHWRGHEVAGIINQIV